MILLIILYNRYNRSFDKKMVDFSSPANRDMMIEKIDTQNL